MKNDERSTDEIRVMIDKLYRSIGIRLNINLQNHPEFDEIDILSQNDFFNVSKLVLDHMELPVSIIPDFSSKFESTWMTKNRDGVTQGIAAQIALPKNEFELPYIRTMSMNNYPVHVTIPPASLSFGCYRLMANLSHEYSHLYMGCSRDPQRGDEWAVDLCALMMGFIPAWKKSRVMRWNEQNKSITSKLGYLTDAQFRFADNYIGKLREPFERQRSELFILCRNIQSGLNELDLYLNDIYLYHAFHAKHVRNPFKHPDDFNVFSKLLDPIYKSDLKEFITETRSRIDYVANSWLRKKLYVDDDKNRLKDTHYELDAIKTKTDQRLWNLRADYEAIVRNIDISYYTKLFDSRIEALGIAISKAYDEVDEVNRNIRTLKRCLNHFRKHRQVSETDADDAKIFAIVNNDEYFDRTAKFVSSNHERINKIKSLRNAGHKFYTIDDELIQSKIKDLDDILVALRYCKNEQQAYTQTLVRNLTFGGRIRWFWSNIRSK